MLKLKSEIGEFDVRTKFNEFTIKEFNDIINIINNENNYIETYISILEYLKVPEEILDSLSIDNLIEVIKSFNLIDENEEPKNIHKTLEIDGYIYEAYSGDKFKLTIRMSGKIEEIVKANPDNFIAPVMAYIYKRTDLSDKEHNDLAHYNYKIELFNNIKADKCIALFMLIFEKLVKKIQIING